jgi:mediator of RNA polymerase II transcription subunit 4
MSWSICTKEVILSLIDDVELISREMLENCVAPKPKRMSASEHSSLTELLVEKDKKLQAALKVATEQGEVEQQIDEVRGEVEEQDSYIRNLQKQLKEAESQLSNTIYQAKQKLESVEQAQPVLSEDLIKYAHKISASNAVAAPPNWQQGDPRRPYPTDIEMRGGFLARAELPLSQQLQHMAPAPATFPSPAPPQPSPGRAGSLSSHSHSPGRPAHGQFGWNAQGELSMQVAGGGQVQIDTGRGGGGGGAGAGDEVEVMSTDSSSSSSTDSN